ncbi:hypothetical protein AAY473_012024 [Plecturocebus cupreus]
MGRENPDLLHLEEEGAGREGTLSLRLSLTASSPWILKAAVYRPTSSGCFQDYQTLSGSWSAMAQSQLTANLCLPGSSNSPASAYRVAGTTVTYHYSRLIIKSLLSRLHIHLEAGNLSIRPGTLQCGQCQNALEDSRVIEE